MSSRIRLCAAATRSRRPSRHLLCQTLDVRLGGRRLRSPIEAPFDPRTIRFLQSPMLTLGHHRYRRQHDPAILEPLHTQGLPRIALAEGDLATSADGLNFG